MTNVAKIKDETQEAQPPAGTKILSAIAAAMGQVQKVAKGDRNKHDGYNFASIDDFLALVNPICAENGLIVHMQESEREDFTRKGKFGDNAWMRQSFSITLMHVSGEYLPPVTRTVEVLRNGAQAYGSAQSYALKQFWRCILLIPTGDKDDADHAPTDAGTVHREPARQKQPAPPEAIDVAKDSLMNADNLDRLKAIWSDLPNDVRVIAAVIEAKNARKAALEKPAHSDNSDLDMDEVPY